MAGRSCLILLLTLAGSQVALGQPKVTLDPAGLGHDDMDIAMKCEFSPTIIKLLEWTVRPSEDPILTYSELGYLPGPNYITRVKVEENAHTGTHTMTLNQANECDAGTYTCRVTDNSTDAKTSGSAILTVIRMDIDGQSFNSDVSKLQGAKGSVKCFAWWESENFEVTLSRGSADSKKSDKANKDSRDKCGYNAEAELQYDLNSKDPQTFSCEAIIGGEKETIEYTINVEDSNTNGDDTSNKGYGYYGKGWVERGSAAGIQWSVVTFLGMLLTTVTINAWP